MRHYFAAVLMSLALAQPVFGQSSNASVGGFVQDSSSAIVPGVTITATNTDTGVVTTVITNESGTYNFPSLLPGAYKLTATLPGFRPHTYSDVRLSASSTARYNFTLEVGAVATAVDVSASQAAVLADTSATIGQVLTQNNVRDLPLVSNDVLDLLKTMPGVRGEANAGSFAGISTSYVNTTRDGISVTENRYINGVSSTTLINPDLVGEMRVILTPVDAETGRGNGQVQILTRSGTNRFSGAAVWAVRNSAFDANTWSNNRQVDATGVWSPVKPDWLNRHQITASYGGPIVKNKTFFFALYDQQIERRRSNQSPVVLTDCARNGIFRYWERWANGNTDTAISTTGPSPIRPSVDYKGNPLKPEFNPDGITPYDGQLRFFSVFGEVTNTPTQPDCSDAIVQGAPWDSNRTGMDPAGVSQKYLGYMAHPNIFNGGDGLNTAVHRWVRPSHSSGSLSLGSGTDTDAGRKQINIKIDQNFNTQHKVAVNYSYDWINADYGLATWPNGYGSELQRRPQVLTVNFQSTLGASLLNEARFGFRKNWHIILAPWEVTDEAKREVPLSLMLEGNGYPIAYTPSVVGGMTPNSFSCMTSCAQQGNTTPLWQFGDTLSWTKGKHGFKFGGEVRFGHSEGSETPTAPIPKSTGGAGLNPNQTFQNNPRLPRLVSTNQTLANQLLYFMAGSVNSAQQYYFIQSSNHNNEWLDYLDRQRKITDSHQNELAFFFKDDWKITPSFTANLGIRYEYYGVPWEGQGLTAVPVGGGDALFGVSGRSFDNWMNPNVGVDTSLVTNLEFVGPKTVNEGRSAYKKDTNNIGPAVGFAWQVPWFGEGKTNVRGGYQVTFDGGNRYVNLANYLFSNQGFVNLAQTQGPTNGTYFNTANMPSFFPVPSNSLPMQPIPILKQNVNAYAFDSNYATPYVQNFTLSVTRQVSRLVTVDVRYIGTRGMKLYSDLFDLNTANVYYNPVLLDALNRTRAGEDVELFDQMFLGLNLNPGVAGCNPAAPTATCAPVNGTTQRGSQHLRLNTTFRTNLANGDFEAVSNSLNIYNGTGSGVVVGVGGERGTVLRRANKGFNVAGGTPINGGPVVPAGLFPENWIVSNPQYNQANLFSNSGSSNYHSLQAQMTLRPAYGLSFQGTYIWSKGLSVPTAGYTNPADRQKDYTLQANHITHDFRSNGMFELPIGPNKFLFGNSSGWVARLIERWQTAFIVNFSTGGPTSITAGNMLYGNGVADVVGPFNLREGQVQWGAQGPPGQLVGNYFGDGVFGKAKDPQCRDGVIAVDLRDFCTLQAVTLASTGEIVLQNPKPGSRGTIGRQTISLPGTWAFDANIGKTFRISESKSAQVRVDATNILNHPNAGTPSFSINSQNPLGYIASKGTSHREFKALLRLTF
jgi:hypothetical protein